METKNEREKVIDQKWECLLDIFSYIENHMNLRHWDIGWSWFRKWDLWEGIPGRLEKCKHNYFQAEILFDNTLIYKDVDKECFDQILRVSVHELCHIYTGSWSSYLSDETNKNNLQLNLWKNSIWDMFNQVIFIEEQMTNLLDDVIFNALKKESDFTKLTDKFMSIREKTE